MLGVLMRMKSIVSLKTTIGSMNSVTNVKYVVFLASLDIYLKSSICLQNILGIYRRNQKVFESLCCHHVDQELKNFLVRCANGTSSKKRH